MSHPHEENRIDSGQQDPAARIWARGCGAGVRASAPARAIVRHARPALLAIAAIAVLAVSGAAATAPARASEVGSAEELARRFPPGSLVTAQDADAALAAADALHRLSASTYDREREHCLHVFFVNHCLDSARTAQRRDEHEVRRLTLEAHELRRRIDAQVHERDRAEQLRRQAAEDLLRPEREHESMLAAQARRDGAAARALDAERDALQAAQTQASTNAQHAQQQQQRALQDAARPQLETAALNAYREKQEQAAAYARTRERDRAANAKRRSERQAERDAAAKADATATAPAK
jgi:hypothetical protein